LDGTGGEGGSGVDWTGWKQIGGPGDLAKIGSDPEYPLDDRYVLTSDFTLNNWTPIGTGVDPFAGILHGNNHTLTLNGFASPETAAQVGIFGYTGGAEINSLKVVYGAAPFSASSGFSDVYVGAVVGYATDTRLDGISLSGGELSVTGGTNYQLFVGGIAGSTDAASEMSGCASSLPVTVTSGTTHTQVGGLTGHNEGAVKRSYATGAVSGQGWWVWVGGLVGSHIGIVELSYASGAVNANAGGEGNTGGLAGSSGGSSIIRDCYASGAVSNTGAGTQYTGGLIGFLDNILERSYAAGTVSSSGGGTRYTGGLAGSNLPSSTISASAALNQSVGTGTSRRVTGSSALTLVNNYAFQGMTVNGGTVSDTMPTPENHIDGLGKTGAELKTQSTYQSGLGWDFTGVWEMGPPGYPYPVFKWQNGVVHPPADFTPL
jgi:hypothetical protein